LQKDFGDIVQIPAMFGRPQILFSFNVENNEKIFRREGQYPIRRGLETLTYYRQNIRPDIYQEYGSLVVE
jgi:cytochrome P450 family 12